MAETRRVWTIDDVAARFEEAATTGRRLPPVRVQGYFNTWPPFVRKEWEAFAAANERVYRPFPPSPVDIERMLEAMRWVQWLEVERATWCGCAPSATAGGKSRSALPATAALPGGTGKALSRWWLHWNLIANRTGPKQRAKQGNAWGRSPRLGPFVLFGAAIACNTSGDFA